MYLYDEDDELFRRAVLFVVRHQHAGISTLQRNLGLGFRESADLIARMRTRGIVGYAEGSKASPVLVKMCEQCGRIGKQQFTVLESTEHTEQMWFCAAKTSCRKRWPKENKE